MSEASAQVTDDEVTPKHILVPDIDWVTIPAGEFTYGENEFQSSLYLDTFEIARYPVTNRQYQCFIDDGGYSNGGDVDESYVEKGFVQEGDGNEQWWQGLEKPEPEQPNWPQGNRPRTNVNWHEATAFTRWLSARLNDHIRLPFEHEWEKAARDENGLAYPWGDEYQAGFANVNESEMENGVNLNQTTAVGLYPRDESPYQARDMAGNVMEWCNEFKAEQNEQAPVSESSPVLRGGSWYHSPQFARADDRYGGYYPDLRSLNVGFRLLRSPPS